MDKSRYKRPPDVDEALSSMLWTPYDQAASSSSSSLSTDSLTDDEREREKRKQNRYSNPLPNSLNCWNSYVSNVHPTSLRYSFPFYGNYMSPLPIPQTNSTMKLIYTPHENDNMDTTAITLPAKSTSSLSIGAFKNLTTKRSESADIDKYCDGNSINTLNYPTSMVHSFTDEFYQYQVMKILLL